ncbi:MAG: ribonuclease III [SAR202 cluster bacterium]|jgi:ribonuclease-3|nr:ribonuclease III [Dehalococcoidia bacterium]MDE0744458.1 ribonuclease III [SAR202 cluster bacterium]MQG66610.1 ribonuclease III [SAR202 cluster bacterium]|tara:strand:- start:40462 stop:41136 length:675 start_codon:yes stop_codon:yes gene_type:complete
MLAKLEDSFIDKHLFHLSLTHSSWVNESNNGDCQSNERLEFLGDAVIDAVIAQSLYEKYPDFNEGDLTKLRSNIVSGVSLANVARELDIGNYLLLGKGEEGSGGRNKESNLANAFEALVGALFLDRGYSTASQFILQNLNIESPINCLMKNHKDSKTDFQILVQSKTSFTPYYKLISKDGPDHDPVFVVEVLVGDKVIGNGVGTSINKAEMQAAANALIIFQNS